MIQNASRRTIGNSKISLEWLFYPRNQLGLSRHRGSLPKGMSLRKESFFGMLCFDISEFVGMANGSVGLR